MPSPSQRIVRTPRYSRSASSICALDIDGLRFLCSRQASVVSNTPTPFTSIEPPQPERLANLRGNLIVEVEGRVFSAPCVVVPVGQRNFTGAIVADKNWS